MRSRIDYVVLALHVVCSIMHLHSLDRVDGVVRDDDRVSLLICEGMVAVTDVELAQPIKHMVLQLWDKFLIASVSKVLAKRMRFIP